VLVNCWSAAEVPQNQDMTVGKLNLTDVEENQIVKFLETLTDGFTAAGAPLTPTSTRIPALARWRGGHSDPLSPAWRDFLPAAGL